MILLSARCAALPLRIDAKGRGVAPSAEDLDAACRRPTSSAKCLNEQSTAALQMRVIAGSAGGLPLHTPRTELRPTMDRVKAAIFSMLGDSVKGARVLDLFAGTGSLGIEALSRGSVSATFIENDARAVAAIEKNLQRTQLRGTVHAADVFRFLDRMTGTAAFDLIFADPPYAKQPGERDFTPELVGSASLHGALAPDGIFVLEHLPGAKLALGRNWEALRQRRYGATEVAVLRKLATGGEVASSEPA